jgi:hypothetical protein
MPAELFPCVRALVVEALRETGVSEIVAERIARDSLALAEGRPDWGPAVLRADCESGLPAAMSGGAFWDRVGELLEREGIPLWLEPDSDGLMLFHPREVAP